MTLLCLPIYVVHYNPDKPEPKLTTKTKKETKKIEFGSQELTKAPLDCARGRHNNFLIS
jgi:hypothetical protein